MIWFDSAEWEVLCGDGELGQQVEGRALTHIWQPNNANLHVRQRCQSLRILARRRRCPSPGVPSNVQVASSGLAVAVTHGCCALEDGPSAGAMMGQRPCTVTSASVRCNRLCASTKCGIGLLRSATSTCRPVPHLQISVHRHAWTQSGLRTFKCELKRPRMGFSSLTSFFLGAIWMC
jgi:hypothetical protein